MTAGATGRSSSKYSSVWYSAIGFDVTSISIWYFEPNLGIIALKFFQGLPLGSFKKNLTFSIVISFCLVTAFHDPVHSAQKLVGRQEIHQPQILKLLALRIEEHDGGNSLHNELLQQAIMKRIAGFCNVDFDHDKVFPYLVDDRRIMKSDFVEFPARGAPSRIKIDDDRPLQPCSLFYSVI
jgi:hypothetical protein